MALTIEDALADYTDVLGTSAGQTNRTEDRVTYQQHLSAAALMFSTLRRRDVEGFKTLLASERRAYGWGFLSGDEGSAAEAAWKHFADFAEAEIARGAV